MTRGRRPEFGRAVHAADLYDDAVDGWCNTVGAAGLSLVIGWLWEPRLAWLRGCGRASLVSLIGLALVLLLAQWQGGLVAVFAASCGLAAGVLAHRTWLSSRLDPTRG